MTSRGIAAGVTPARLALHTAQSSLFDSTDALPAGLTFAPDFIDADAERALLALAASLPLHEAHYKAYTARRRVVAYGTRLGCEHDAVDDRSPGGLAALDKLPHPLRALCRRCAIR